MTKNGMFLKRQRSINIKLSKKNFLPGVKMTPNLKKYLLVSTTKDSIGMSGTNPAASNQVLTGTADT
jgi:hypothetical protein